VQDEPINRAYKRLRSAIREHKELMAQNQELYYNVFIRTLHLQKDLQSVLEKLLEAAPELETE